MNHEERKAKARALRASGLTVTQVAASLDVSRMTVRRDLDEQARLLDNELSRRWKKKRPKGVCGECGGPTSWSDRVKGYPRRCQWCQRNVPMKDRPPEVRVKVKMLEGDVKIPEEVERRLPPSETPKGRISAQLLTTSYDCQAYACVRDAEPGEMFCRKHLDSLAKTG